MFNRPQLSSIAGKWLPEDLVDESVNSKLAVYCRRMAAV